MQSAHDSELSALMAGAVPLKNMVDFKCERGQSQDQSLQAQDFLETNQHLSLILESITDPVLTLDEEWRLTYVNRAVEKMVGKPRAELLGQIWWKELPLSGEPIALKELHRAIAEQVPISCDLYYSPSENWYEIKAYPTGQGLSIYLHTITHRKQTEETLRPSRDLHEAIFNESTDALFLVDPDTLRTVDCNQRAVDLFEASARESLIGIEGHTLQRRPFTAPEMDGIVAGLHKTGLWMQEIEYVTCQGNSFWGNLAAKAIWIGTRALHLVRITDVTHLKQTEMALRASQQRYRDLAEAMPQMVWTAEGAGVVNYFNQRWYEYSGLTETESLGSAGTALIYPDDRDRTLVQWQQAMAHELAFEIEYRIRRWDGVYRWFINRGVPICDAQQQVTGWIGTITDIHDLKQAEWTVSRSEQQVRRVLDSLYTFVGVMTPEGVLIEANRPALEAASLHPEDVLGRPLDETYWWSYSLEVRAQLRTAIAQARRGEGVRYDVQVRVGPDQFIIIDFALVPMLDASGQVEYLIPSGIDVTQRRQMESALRESQAQLQRQLAEIEAIYQSIPVGLNVLDSDLRFVRINQQLAEINGLSAEAHIGHTVREVLPSLADTVEEVLYTVLTTGEPLLNVEISGETPAHPGVQRTWVEHFLPLKNGDQVVGVSTVCEEITTRKQAEVEREQLLQREQAAREMAETSNRIKDEFLTVLSHELRTPLNPILGWTKLLRTQTFSPEQTQHALAKIERNAQLQVQLIDDLLDISSIIHGKLSLKLAPISVIQPLAAAIETVHQTAEAKAIRIESRLDPEVGDVVGDAGRLQQVFWNLLSNAIKFTPAGGQVTVQLKQCDRTALIQITDTGKGISPDFLPYLFERFRQQDSSTTRQFGGLGLGLSISQQLIEAHGGTIVASSAGENQGSTFIVRLPQIPTLKQDTPALPVVEPHLKLQGVRVLVVDDEPDSLEFMQLLLAQEGAVVTTVASALAALEVLSQFPVDVLVSDIQMPQLDGYGLIRQVRSHPVLHSLPAIALSAYAYEDNRKQSLVAGYHHHLVKPVDPTILVSAIALLVP